MSLREAVELYSKLTGKDGTQESIVRIGAYLDGYEKGKEDAEPHWIPVTKEEMFKAGYEGREIRFKVDGRLFAIRELAQ